MSNHHPEHDADHNPNHGMHARSLELSAGAVPFTSFATFDLSASDAHAPSASLPATRDGAPEASDPISVSAPRPVAQSGPARLSELVVRAEPLVARLESSLANLSENADRAAKSATELDERLRLGVRMLQAFDVQVERCAKASDAARGTLSSLEASIDTAREAIQSLAAPVAAESANAGAMIDEDAVRTIIDRALDARLSALDATVDGRLHGIVDERLHATLGERLHGMLDERLQGMLDERLAGMIGERLPEWIGERLQEWIGERLQGMVDERLGALVTERLERAGFDDAAIETKLASIDEQIGWRVARAHEAAAEVEARIDAAIAGKLAWIDGELGARLERLGQTVGAADHACGRIEHALGAANERAAGLESALERLAALEPSLARAERASEAIDALGRDAERHIETLAARNGDAAALRESLGTTLHELSAARETAHGELRRLRDDLGWLVEKAERISGELVEKADDANRRAGEVAGALEGLAPAIAEVESLREFLAHGQDRVAPIAESLAEGIASSVRDELRADMRGFATALRQLATRAESSFSTVRIDASLLARDHRVGQGANHSGPNSGGSNDAATGLTAAIASELSRLSGTATEAPPTIAVNRPVELEA
ncbi:MAG: hypothetical protein RI967_1298 [Planctomycetota bacterium]